VTKEDVEEVFQDARTTGNSVRTARSVAQVLDDRVHVVRDGFGVAPGLVGGVGVF